jgi:hypothetical protein
MSLLQLLNLPQPKYLALVQGGPSLSSGASAPVASGAAHSNGAKPAEAKGAQTNGGGDADVLAEAKKARGAIEARERGARETLIRFNKLSPLLDQKIASATGEAKKKLLEQKGQFDKKTAEAVKTVDQAKADLEAIDNPASGREELVRIMARHRSNGKVAEEMEISSPGLDSTRKKVNHDVTTTTTSYENGGATTETEHDKQHVGMNGVTREHSTEKVVQTADSTARNSEEKKSHVSLTGKASVETKKLTEIELADGRKSSAEHSTSKEISAKGAEQSETHKVTNLDGSGTSTTNKQSVERGEGQVTATTSASVTKTSKSGTDHTTDKKASGGFDAKDGAIGAHGGLDGGKSVTNKKGMQAGVVAGVHANVMCKIGEPKGDPKMYQVTLTVSFEATAGVSAGAGNKEGSKASIGVEAKGSLEKSMTVTHVLGEADLADYTKALQDASKKGGKAAATHAEFGIISAGVNQGWDAARALYSGKALGKKTADTLTHAGDSITVTEKKTGTIGAKVKVKAVGGGVSVSDSQEDSKRLKRNDKGTLDVDTNSAHTRQKSLSGSVDLGAAGMDVGTTHTHQTSFGYSITIDPKNDPEGKILEALGACKTQDQFEAFIKTYKGKMTLTARTKGKSDADRTDTGVNVLGLKAGMGTHTGVDEQTKTDAKGKLIHKTVVGHAGVDAKLGSLAESEDDDATAEIDGDGEASLDMKTTKNSNHGSRAVHKKLKHAAEKLAGEGKKSGALTSAAGGEEDDSTTHDVAGLTLTTGDLKKLGKVACNSIPAFMGAARRWQDKDDLREAAVAIKNAKGAPGAVAEQLARYIGGGIKRKEAVEMYVRGGYHAQTGHAYEFPDELHDIVDDYNEVVDDKLPERMDIMANKKGNQAAAEECKRLAVIADRIEPKIDKCDDFDNEATKGEMLSRLSRRRQLLNEAIQGYGGLGDKADKDAKVLEDKCNRLIKLCGEYYGQQIKLQVQMANADTITVSERIAVRKLIKKLEDLQFRWQQDHDLMEALFEKRKVAMPIMPMLKPDTSIVTFFEKKIGDA